MNIRKASKEDCGRIVNELWKPFMEYCSGLDEFSGLDRGAETIFYNHLCDFVSDPNNVVFLAEDPPAIVGYVKAAKANRPPVYETKIIGEISDIFVLPEYRKSGIGYQLVKKTEEWFEENGLSLAWLKVHSTNELGNAFWESVGYKSYMIERMKTIKDNTESTKERETPKLVVLCGFPCSGKSTIADYLHRKHNFAILNTDVIREDLGYVFNPFSDNLQEKERKRFHEMEEIMLHTINLKKHKLILEGRDIVVDSCAIYEKTRNDLLFSYMAEKYLVFLDVDKEILVGRNLQKGRKESKRALEELESKYWQEPSSSEDYIFLEYQNNSQEDLEALLRDLELRLSL